MKPGDLVRVAWRFDTPRLGLIIAKPPADYYPPQVLVELIPCGSRVSFSYENVEVLNEAR
jgi:hypothetical protein